MRDYNQEHQDGADRSYAYDFDGIIRRYLLQTLAPWFQRPGSALELGCYRGDMTAQLLGYFETMTIVEASDELADLVRRRFPGQATVINSTFAALQLEQRFDHIFLVHTLEHLDDPVAELSNMRRWLSAKGRLFVAVPNANALSRQLAVKMGLVEFHAAVTPAEAAHGHRRTYSMDVLLAQLRQAGFRLDDHGGILVKPLANYQFDLAIAQGIITPAYLDACHALAKTYPELSASLFAVCSRGD